MTDSPLRSTLIVLALFALALLLPPTDAGAQTPVVEATNDSDQPVLQVNDDGSLVAPYACCSGVIPATGAGTRLMWHPEKAAFRAGSVDGTQWDDVNVGLRSLAIGENPTASGEVSIALGEDATASGEASVAIGQPGPYATPGATASGTGAFAMGNETTAGGAFSVAIGGNGNTAPSATASGNYAYALGSSRTVASGLASYAFGDNVEASGQSAVAIGTDVVAGGAPSFAIGEDVQAPGEESMALGFSATTGSTSGSFIIGTGQGAFSGNKFTAAGNNQFAAIATHFWLGDDEDDITYDTGNLIETSTGASLTDGGTWTNSSDATKKVQYRPVDGEALLHTLRELPVRTWSYRDEPNAVRHMGPTAQDFYAAFGLGSSNTTISTVDIDGVNTAAIQALTARTEILQKQNAALEARVARLEQMMQDRSALSAGVGTEILGGLLILLLLGGGTVLWHVRAQQA